MKPTRKRCIKTDKINEKLVILNNFCLEKRNVHKKVKYLALEMKKDMKELLEQSNKLRIECLRYEAEMKRLRRIVVQRVELSFQIRENSLPQALAVSSPITNQSLLSLSRQRKQNLKQLRSWRKKKEGLGETIKVTNKSIAGNCHTRTGRD